MREGVCEGAHAKKKTHKLLTAAKISRKSLRLQKGTEKKVRSEIGPRGFINLTVNLFQWQNQPVQTQKCRKGCSIGHQEGFRGQESYGGMRNRR